MWIEECLYLDNRFINMYQLLTRTHKHWASLGVFVDPGLEVLERVQGGVAHTQRVSDVIDSLVSLVLETKHQTIGRLSLRFTLLCRLSPVKKGFFLLHFSINTRISLQSRIYIPTTRFIIIIIISYLINFSK